VNIDLEILDLHRRILAPIYTVCKECFDETKKQITDIREMNPKELPLYISDPNIFVREAASKKLECQNPN
jgi:hypothetical protein